MKLLENIKSVLIVRCGALGDLVYSASVMDALIKQYGPDVQIDWVCTPGPGTLFTYDKRVRNVFPLKHRKPPIWLSPQKRKIIAYSKEHPYDLLINLETGEQFDALCKKVESRHKLGTPFTTLSNDHPKENRAVTRKRVYADVISPDILEESVPRLFGTPLEMLKKKLALPENYIAVAPTNSHIKKQRINYRAWPNAHWSRLINALATEHNVVILGAKGEEAILNEFELAPSSNIINFIGKNSITDLVTVIEQAQCLVTTDTAPAHIAAAVNTPLYILMGPNDPVTDSPYQTKENEVNILRTGIACSPCYNTPTMFACRDNVCMREIDPDELLSTIKKSNLLKA